ncbi:hypothetical protein B0J14DRAFT_682520 [Halenospora varia]|nr:hypothetical protein B0J14DRAFT_682520 [Halenospora varia]
MALLLAPYNESMRLGQGFNPYTKRYVLTKLSKFRRRRQRLSNRLPSSRFVEKLGQCRFVSYSATIKKGNVESADLNAIVSVRVVNQTTSVITRCQFKGLRGYVPGTPKFNEVFGDCYISGFMEGVDFTGMISIKVFDQNNVKEVTDQIKSAMGSYGKGEFSLDRDPFENGGNQGKASKAIRDTEWTVLVSWMGGGQIKDGISSSRHASGNSSNLNCITEATQWDLGCMFAAAAAFPSKVASCHQKPWAILTKCKANRSFVRHANSTVHPTLEYDQISSYTAELFDNFMDYKLLLKSLQTIARNRGDYLVKPSEGSTVSIGMSMKTLLRV